MAHWRFLRCSVSGWAIGLLLWNDWATACGAEPQFVVSTSAFHSLEIAIPPSKEIATQLASQKWCLATASDGKHQWNKPPSGVPQAEWLSCVTVGFNEQADAYAFQFGGPDGAMTFASHLPFRKTWIPGNTLAWRWPTDGFVGAVRVASNRNSDQTPHKPLSLKVVPWKEENTTRSRPSKNSLGEARTADPKVTFAAIEVIAQAAAFEAGFAPTPGKAEWSAVCEVRPEDQGSSLRLTLVGPTGERVLEKQGVSCEAYHDYLVRMFRHVPSGTGVSDFKQLARTEVRPLAVDGRRLAVLVDNELAVYDLATGKRSWTTDPPNKPKTYRPTEQYTSYQKVTGDLILACYRGQLSELAWDSGKRTILSPVGSDRADDWSVDGDDVAVTGGGSLRLFRQQKQLWEQKVGSIAGGPLLQPDQVIFTDDKGNIRARARADGGQRDPTTTSDGLQGPIVAAGVLLFVFSSLDESLVALDRATLTERWRTPVGDVLLTTQPLPGSQLLVATKGNRLLVLDTKTGVVQHEKRWSTWLVAVTVLPEASPPQIAVSDLAGTVTLLALPDLTVRHELHLKSELVGAMPLARQMADVWPIARSAEAEEDLLEELSSRTPRIGPTLLVADKQGFVYLLPLTSQE